MSVVTRFAPSPTGFLHIGGARTALFNLLYARRHGGRYLLRIEDTDRSRSTPEAVSQILESLAWLGLSPDAEPVFQSTREARHAEVAHQLLVAGKAYLAYDTTEELQAARETALREGRPPRYPGTWRDRDPSDAPADRKPTIRLKAPREGETLVDDLVQGTVRVQNQELDDMIILRSDGSPTYLHAVVVDDHDMGISHVIRGDDHLTNTFRQAQVYDSMGWERPRFAHIPLIHGADGAKLSKRHGAVSVLDFREQGFLPEAVSNYLLRLGWAHGDAEILSRSEAETLFDLDGVGRSASRFDYAKLGHLNGVWIRRADDAELCAEVLKRLSADPTVQIDPTTASRLARLMPGLKERARSLVELAQATRFLVLPLPLPIEPKARLLLTPEALGVLAEFRTGVERGSWRAPDLEEAARRLCTARGIALKDLAMPLRAALTGSTTSPPVFDVMEALGIEATTLRLRSVIPFVPFQP